VSLPPLAPVSALETRLGLGQGTLAGADLARAEAALGDVSALVRTEAGSPLVDPDGVTIAAPEAILAVTLAVALRVYLNPEGYQGESVEGYSWQAPQGAVGLILTDDETAAIRNAVAGSTAGGYVSLGSVRTPSAYDSAAAAPFDIWGGPA
jgi:hypothetical protein